MFFGKKLREIRLKYNYGLYEFAKSLKVKPSVLCNVEHGYIPLSESGVWIREIREMFGLKRRNEDIIELHKLYNESFIMQKMPENITLSDACAVNSNEYLPEEDLIDIDTYINAIAKEHNKKADEYNKEHNE